jgi:heat-inducible transcriptional repressor
MIHTETLYYTEKKLSSFSLKRIEAYFHWRITGLDKPELTEEEEKQAVLFYNEIMLRHIVTYTNFSAEDIYKTGFSNLLNYSDFNDASSLASGLSLFENPNTLRTLLRKSCEQNQLSLWIGDELQDFSIAASSCSVIAIPYRINQTTVGAMGILGPHRIPYKRLFGILQTASDVISETLTKSIYKFKITFRQPQPNRIDSKTKTCLDQTTCLLLEDKTK